MFAAIGPFVLDLFLEAPVIGGPFAVLVGTWLVWCLQPSQRRVDVSAEAMFRSPPEAVASVMFDVSQQPRWMESIKAASLVTPGLLRVGSVIRQTAIVAGTDLAATLRVNELVPYQRLALALEGSPSDTIDVLEVAAQDGGSLVTFRGTHRISFAVAVLTGWRTPSLRRTFAKNRAASLERLRALVERAAPSHVT
jgi:hypothetical protein